MVLPCSLQHFATARSRPFACCAHRSVVPCMKTDAIAHAAQRPHSRHSGVRPSAAAARHLKSSLRRSNALFTAQTNGSTSSCGSRRRLRPQVVATQPDPTIPETEKERSPLDYPQEWVTPQPSRRPDIFPEFDKQSTPMPKPMPGDPEMPDEEEEEDEEKKKKEDPDKEKPEEDPDAPAPPQEE